MNLPNKLTISRIVLVFVFMYFLFTAGIAFKIMSLITFILAALTDYFDGKIARERNLVTNLGKILDPIADKLLTLSAFLAFVQMGIIPAWMVLIIILRELLITGLRLFAATFNKIIASSKSGKHKTFSQISAIIIILIFLIIKEFGQTYGFWQGNIEKISHIFIYTVMLITVILTGLSGISFLIKNKDIFLNAKNQ